MIIHIVIVIITIMGLRELAALPWTTATSKPPVLSASEQTLRPAYFQAVVHMGI